MNSSKIYIHIGLQKTATTFFQNNLWPSLYPESSKGLGKVRTHQRLIYNYLQKGQGEKDLFFSCEKLAGELKPKVPGDSWKKFYNTFEHLEVAHARGDQIYILVVIRPQVDWIKSAWSYTRMEGSTHSFKKYIKKFNEQDISWYQRLKLLSKFNLRVVCWGDFISDQERCVKDICEFLNRPLSDEEVREIVNRKVKRNSSPKTMLSLYFAYFENRFRKLYRLLFKKKISLDFRDRVISYIDEKNFMNTRFKNKLVVPEELHSFMDDDWNKTIDFINKNNYRIGQGNFSDNLDNQLE